MKHLKQHTLWICSLILMIGCTSVPKEPVQYVDPMIGTGFHGHTYPGATVPFGMVQLSPDTRQGNWDACSGYHYSDSTLLGFSHTHLSGTGCIDLGDILFRPLSQTPQSAKPLYKPTRFSHEQETAKAGYYQVYLPEEDVTAELTATTYTGVHRYTYGDKAKESVLLIDLLHTLDTDEHIYTSTLKQTSETEIVGMRNTRGWVDQQQIYFVAQFSTPIQQLQIENNTEKTDTEDYGERAVLNFGRQKEVVVKVGLSLVSIENARANLLHDIKDGVFDFDAVRAEAEQKWRDALSVITIEKGGTEVERTNFYTALYHTMLAPTQVSDCNGAYRKHDMSIGQLAEGEVAYSTLSLWDTFRAWHPMMTLLQPKKVEQMIRSMLMMYETTGELPIWPLSAGETGTMIGYHSVSVIADAYLKGIRGFDAELALRAMIASSEKNKKGADFYIKYGFIPSNFKRESVSCLLEFAYDDWCISQMAKEMGNTAVYDTYIARSMNYMNVFDGQTKFFRGKRMDGNWESPFNPNEPGRAYTEATAWQYRFFVPHDVYGLSQLFGGREAFITALDELFTTDAKVEGELSDITGLVGQYAHGNEPSHHIAYLYSYVGEPWKTQAMTRKLLTEMYQPTPEGIIGNEDCGQMSAWYIMSGLGFYPVCPGSNEYVLTAPLFEEVSMKLGNGKILKIVANASEKRQYIAKVFLNGKEIKENYITHTQLLEGGELKFELTDQPQKERGTSQKATPYSYTQCPTASIPYIVNDVYLFQDSVAVELRSTTEGATIHYTLDGTEPTQDSPRFNSAFYLTADAKIKAKAFKQGLEPSKTFEIQATKAVLQPSQNIVPTAQGMRYRYYEGTFKKVADLELIQPLAQGVFPLLTIEEAPADDHFGYVFTGCIQVPEDGIYSFQVTSDDGSILWIGAEKVVDNDGSHAAIPATGSIALQKGYHTYKLYYFEDYEGQHLSWAWKTPHTEKFVPIPQAVLYYR